ncbi:HlyD family efflux transporter periplasmic adaptor subunit [Draconibacterium sp. IB214405]|uniref:HlyD family secretion protein n=1 Tax=Draconibacterium sp. IB214405 TaxID=3097352 RepID=UPI002A15C440|nr:HlyD family efflux transporter periplasmic adaptor subunit [Draconibacterium sp. IB214405]MDX8340590.1 HlyD family efflux transporter periplasmic adaptor subunit [Draconibacterium sp. IB214405]
MKKILYIISLPILFMACQSDNDTADAYGNFEAETVIVSAETPGKILELNVDKGDKIEAGYSTALIDTVQLHLQLLQLDAQQTAVVAKRQSIQSQIAVFEEQKASLEINEERITKMLKDGAATQKQLDDIQGQISVIDKQIANTKTQFTLISKEQEVLEAQKASLSDQLNRCTIKSPVSGTILETYAEQGELTTAGKALLKIADISELELKVYVSGAQLPHVKLGQQLDVMVDQNSTENQHFSGTITWISSEAEFTPKIIQTKEERVKLVYAVKVTVKNDGTLKIGMPGEVRWN